MESKKERFNRLAEQRTSKIIEYLASLSKLSSKKNYEYTDYEIKQIFKAIDEQLKITKIAFKDHNSNQIFKLKSK